MSDPAPTRIPSDSRQLLTRSIIYRALSVLLRHPSWAAGGTSFQEETAAWQEALEVLNVPHKTQLKDLMSMIVKELNWISREEWIRQYEHLFGHAVQGVAACYELEYGEEHSHRQPQELSDIASFYGAFGLKPSEKVHERVDHIAVECEFMHFLIFKEAYAFEQDDEKNASICREASCRFLSEHLGRWLPSFAFRLSKAAQESPFKHIADFTFRFVVEDCRNLNIQTGLSDLPIRIVDEKIESGCVSCVLNPESQR